jgi:4-amino-4-deoxy-L-arabinose transferase-like glycosyltransferase
VIAIVTVKIAVHLALVGQYGYHGDELYFIECGRRLASGYVDHPPLIPWIARVADEMGGGLLALRLPAILAGAGTLVFVALLVREWEGGWRAQLIALLSLLVAPAHLRMAAMLNIPVIEVFLCAGVAYLVARALRRGERWTWLLAGVALGLAILTKHSSVMWGAALALGLVMGPSRRVLATRWPWLGLSVALLFAAPNLAWQVQHDFATLEFLRELRHDVLEHQGRALFLAGQLLYFHPLVIPIVAAGLVASLRRRDAQARPFAWLFVALGLFLVVAGGKPYYLASAYPPLLAAGAIAVSRWLDGRAARFAAVIGSLAITGTGIATISLPALPLRQVDSAAQALFGWIVPPMALTHDMHGMYGWDAQAATIDQVYATLPREDQPRTGVLAGSYAHASAVNVLGAPSTPRAVSGHMTYHLWGPDEDRGSVLIAFGIPRALLDAHYRSCVEAARIHSPLARPSDVDLPVFVCREPSTTMAEMWPRLRNFSHRRPALTSRPGRTASSTGSSSAERAAQYVSIRPRTRSIPGASTAGDPGCSLSL